MTCSHPLHMMASPVPVRDREGVIVGARGTCTACPETGLVTTYFREQTGEHGRKDRRETIAGRAR